MNALKQAVERIAEGTPLRVQAGAELAALIAERDAWKEIVFDVVHGNYDNAHDITAARKFIFAKLEKMPK